MSRRPRDGGMHPGNREKDKNAVVGGACEAGSGTPEEVESKLLQRWDGL